MVAQNDKLQTHLRNKENLRFLVNEWSIKLLQEAKELKVLKKKLDEYVRRLQKTVKELERKNYYLKRESRILKGFVRDYQSQNRFLEGFTLMVFILKQLFVKLYLLGLFNENDIYVTIF